MAPEARSLAGPALGSAWQPARPGQPRPLDSGSLSLVTLPTSPFWARRYTRSFLNSCRGMSESTAETAELIVSELVTNAVRFSGDPGRALRYSERADAGLIALSLRHFPGRTAHRGVRHRQQSAGPVRRRRGRGKRPGTHADRRAGQGMVVLLPSERRQSRVLPTGHVMSRRQGQRRKPPARAGLDTARAGP
jgi:anti-sigma regulatory factor (Ser/Thr protein kinase)